MLRRIFSPAVWFVALFAAVVLNLPWQPERPSVADHYTLEIELTASAPGQSQLYFDVGRNLNEEDLALAPLAGTGRPERLRFRLRAGTYHAFRFDPVSSELKGVITKARIIDERGRERLRFPLTSWEPGNEIENLKREPAGLRIETTKGASDPSVWLPLEAPLMLEATTSQSWRPWVKRILPWTLGIVLALALFPFGRPLLVRLDRWRERRPAWALALVALAATLASSYPVVFFGQSQVSPNYGARLLYDAVPTLPGHTDARYEEVNLSDIGALMFQHIPMSFVQARALEAGELPLWNRYNSTGTMLLGQGQSMVGDPLQFLVVLAGADAWAWDLKFLTSKFLLCFGVGLLAWGTTRQWIPAALIGGSCGFIGFFLFRINHPAFFSFCYAPWILVAWLGLVQDPDRRKRWRNLAGLILVNGMVITSGTVKEAYMLLLSLNATGVLLVLSAGEWNRRERAVLLLQAAGAGVVFLLLTAPLWVTLAEALRISYSGYNQPSAYQIHPSFLIGFFDEIFYRPIQTLERVSNPSANFLFLGGLLYLAASWRRNPPGTVGTALAFAFAASLAMAFGVVPPQWIERVPFLGNVAHIDNCFSLVAIILAGPLSALGWSAAAKRLGGPEGRGDLVVVTFLLAGLVALWVSTTQTVHKPIVGWDEVFSALKWGQRLPVSAFVWGSLIALPVGLLIGFLALRRVLSSGQCTVATGGALVVCLFVLLWRHGQQLPSAFDGYVFNPTARTSFFTPSAAIETVLQDRGDPFRVVGTDGSFVAGWSPAYGLEGISGPDALINRWYRELTDALGIDRINDWRLMVRSETFPAQRPIFDFLGVKYYFNHHGSPGPWEQALAPVVMTDLDVYRSDHAWPRAFYVSSVMRYNEVEELAARIKAGPTAPFASVHASECPPGWPSDETSANVVAARNYQLTPNSTQFSLQAPGAGLAVLHEAWLPNDFKVSLNGRPADVVRVNHAFKGVWLPHAGDWTVNFTYRPRYLNRALAASGLGFFIVLVISATFVRRRFRTRG